MAFPDTLSPVVLNATVQTVVSTEFFLRDVAFISLGNTTLTSGAVAQIDETSYLSILSSGYTLANNELYRQLNSFYKYATSKPAYIIELGEIAVTALENNITNLRTYLATLTGDASEKYSENDFLVYVYDNQFETLDTNDELASAKAYLEANYSGTYTADAYSAWLADQADTTDSIANLRAYLESIGASVVLDGANSEYIAYLNTNNTYFSALITLENLLAYAEQASLNFSNDLYEAWLVAQGSTDETQISTKIATLKEMLTEGAVKAYWYVAPSYFSANADFIALVTNYSNTTDYCYFVVTLPSDESPAEENSTNSQYGGAKSLIAVYDNSSSATNSLAGAVAGKFASSIFDISANQKASPFNYKIFSGYTFSALENTFRNVLTQACVNYGGTLASNNVFLNGRCGDGKGIDYWYQWDLTAYYLDLQIITLLLNGVNNPNYAIRYNQDGIDTIKASVESVLDKMIDWGCLTEYGASYDSATNEISNTNHVYAIGFQDYISANPSDYENEIYSGISVYLRIGKYIRQVVLNITLG